jgi:peptidyl-prolyl cis-trans isomerase C
MKISAPSALALFLSIVFVAGTSFAQVPGAPAPAAAPPAGGVIVTVDGEEITTEMVDRMFRGMFAQQIAQVPPDQIEAAQRQAASAIVGELIAKTLLSNAATAAKLEVSEEDVAEALAEVQGMLPPGATMEQYLTAMGQTEEGLKADIAGELSIQKLVEGQTADVAAPTDEAVKNFYDENEERFKAPESVKARHILVSIEGADTEEALAEKKSKADDIRKQVLEAKGANFEDLAKTMSDGPSGPRGGDLGEFGRGQMVPEFDAVVFTMKPGEVSEVVKTQFGYHVIKVDEVNEARTLPYDEVKEQLSEQMLNEEKSEKLRSYVEELRSKAKIVPTNPGPAGDGGAAAPAPAGQ